MITTLEDIINSDKTYIIKVSSNLDCSVEDIDGNVYRTSLEGLSSLLRDLD